MAESAAPALPHERPGHAPPDWLIERREAMAKALAAGAWRTDPPPRTERLNDVRVLRFESRKPKRGVILHLHGGGFRMGRPEMSAPFAVALADRCQVEVVCPAYRLAPEHPFPAGLNDAHAVFRALAEEGGAPIILSGDSAGGGLAAGLAALCAIEGRRAAGLVLLSPWLDLTVSSPTYQTNATSDPLFSEASAQQAAELYLQGQSPIHPLASPLFGPFIGLPPALISVGAEEVLAEDSRRYHAALHAAGAPARLLSIAGMQHVAATRDLALPGAAETFDAVAAFIEGLVA